MSNTDQDTEKLQEILSQSKKGGRLFSRRNGLILAALLAILAGLFLALGGKRGADQPQYVTEAAARGPLVVKVSATGTLAPTNEVEVGSEQSGTVEEVYVDVNDRVKKGQLLARLDVSKLKDAVAKSKASLAAAEAQVLQMQATVTETRATLARMKHVAELSGGKVPSKTELDTAEANLQRAIANEANARSTVAQAQAGLSSDQTSLTKAYIHSPIDGVVLTRKIEPGQTVAASLEAPVLFKLAEDLSKMELQVNVDEADVGQVKEGQHATFTVDAWPKRKFAARITRVSYGSKTTDEVVSYLTNLQVDNRDLSLRPGMTATAEIVTAELKDALLIPNAALRFSPAETAAPKKSGGLLSALLPHPPAQSEQKAAGQKQEGRQRIWVLQNGQATALDIATGQTDGQHTEVTGGDLKPGMQVITDSTTKTGS